MALWADVVRSPGSRDFVRTFTDRVGRLADETPPASPTGATASLAPSAPTPDPANLTRHPRPS